MHVRLAPCLVSEALHSHTTKKTTKPVTACKCKFSIILFSISLSALHPFGHFPLSPQYHCAIQTRQDSLTVKTSCYTRVSLMLAEKASRYTNSNLLSKVLFPRVLHAIQYLTGFLRRRRSARQSLNSDPSIIFLFCLSFL